MADNQVKLVEISEQIISIQNDDATYSDHVIEIDEEKLKRFREIQQEFQNIQNELLDLIEGN